jgi:hypothetical protein
MNSAPPEVSAVRNPLAANASAQRRLDPLPEAGAAAQRGVIDLWPLNELFGRP